MVLFLSSPSCSSVSCSEIVDRSLSEDEMQSKQPLCVFYDGMACHIYEVGCF